MTARTNVTSGIPPVDGDRKTIWRESQGLGRDRVRKQKIPELERNDVTWPYLKRFLKELKPIRSKVVLSLALMPLAAMGLWLVPGAIKVLIDGVIPLAQGSMTTIAGGESVLPRMLSRYFEPGSYAVIIWFGIVFATLIIAAALITFLMRYMMMLCGEWLVARMRNKLHNHIQFLSIRYIEDTQVGGIISRVVSDVQAVRNLLFGGFLDFLLSLVTMTVLLGWFLYLDWRMTLASIALVPGFTIVFLKSRKRLRPAWKHIRAEMALLTARIAEVFGGAKVVKAFGKERQENAGFVSWVHDLFRKALWVHIIHMGMHAGADGVANLGRVIVLVYGSWLVVQKEISPGDLIAFVAALAHLFQPMIQAVSINTQMQRAMASLERIYDVLDMVPEVSDRPDAIRVNRLEGEVIFDKVSFRYDEANPLKVIDEVSFQANPGECLAIVGASGAGKTTLTNLLARFYDVQEGRILVDGNDIRDLELAPYRRNLAVVLQDTWLFNGTISENISYAVSGATEEEIRAAAEQANALEFIEKLPNGFSEQTGERGVKLSGGQKQRIAIARAILADPRILILDEATSSLDSHSEALIQEALERLMKGRTTLVIAHRLSTITNADRILVLDDGSIVESGTHRQLLAAGGTYYHMFMEQYGKVKFLRNAVERYAEHLVEEHSNHEPAGIATNP